MDAKEFKELTGCDPVDDDLERTNCLKTGQEGHITCGVCPEHNLPRFLCFHNHYQEKKDEVPRV